MFVQQVLHAMDAEPVTFSAGKQHVIVTALWFLQPGFQHSLLEFQSIGQSSGCDLTCVQAGDGMSCVVAGMVERAGWHKLRAVFGRAW